MVTTEHNTDYICYCPMHHIKCFHTYNNPHNSIGMSVKVSVVIRLTLLSLLLYDTTKDTEHTKTQTALHILFCSIIWQSSDTISHYYFSKCIQLQYKSHLQELNGKVNHHGIHFNVCSTKQATSWHSNNTLHCIQKVLS
jgi:hypothetical protein